MRNMFFLLCVFLLSACGGTPSRTMSQPTRKPDPYVTFTTVRNECGACGTNSPVGGWEAADGRTLILSSNGTYAANFTDGTSMQGKWEQNGSQLCLEAGSSQTCFSYQQKTDAMKLDNAIYIRR